ncbi:MAG: hypothetical protein GY788_05170, partial [bacterium]|nr:hypothetical protein [bacterium]
MVIGVFDKIQTAIDDALTLDGYTIRVNADNYAPPVIEDVVVSKQLTLVTDTNAGIDPNTGVRGTEVEVDSFDIAADGVTIDGFKVVGESAVNAGVRVTGEDSFTLKNSILTGTDAADFNHNKLQVSGGTNVTITNNLIEAGLSGGGRLVQIVNASSGLFQSNVVNDANTQAQASRFDGLGAGVDQVSVLDNSFTSTSNRTGISEFNAAILLGDYTHLSGNTVTYTGTGSDFAAISLGSLSSMGGQNNTIENNVSISGGSFGIFVANGNDNTISEDINIFTGQDVGPIVAQSFAADSGTPATDVTIDVAALIATGGQYAKATDVLDPSGGAINYDDGTGYFATLEDALDHAKPSSDVFLSSTYADVDGVSVDVEDLTIDVVPATTGTLTLGAGVTTLALTGDGDVNVTGNALDNNITGSSGNNTLNGGIGDDNFFGEEGDDTIDGGTGTNKALYHGDPGDYTVVVGVGST